MYFSDHNPPHFHAHYAGSEALIEISTLSVFAGGLPPRAMGLVVEWATSHQEELSSAWERARAAQAPGKIEPLA